MIRPAIQAASLAALVLIFLFGAHPTFAQEDAAQKQAKEHYQKGMVYFQSGDYPNAVNELKQAYQIKRIAALLFNIGQTYRKMDDTDMAVFYFEKFLREAPPNAPQRGEAEKILGELKAKKSQGGGIQVPAPLDQPEVGPPPPVQQPPPRRRRMVEKFEHHEVEEAPPQTPLDVRIQLPEQEGVRATLYYRTAGQDNYTAVPMRQRYDEWVGRIPGEMIVGKSFQYYIEARDGSGSVIGKSGSAGAPNIVSIVEGAKPQFYADLTEGPSGGLEQRELQQPVKKSRRRHHRVDDEEEGGEEPRTLHNFRKAKWVVGGIAAGALLLGVVSEVIAWSESNSVEDKACLPPSCSQPPYPFNLDKQSAESTGQAFNTVGWISLIAGGAATAAAVTLWLMDDSAEMEPEQRRPHRAIGIAPLVAPTPQGTVYGLGGTFRF